MIIKSEQPEDHLHNAKVRLYEFMRAVTTVILQAETGLIQLFIAGFILVIPYVAIEFKYNDFFPPLPSKIFRMFLLTNMSSEFGINETIITAIVMVIDLVIIFCTAYHLLFQAFFDPLTKLVTMFIKIMQFLAVPVLDFSLMKFMMAFQPESTTGDKIIGAFVMVFSTLAILVAILQFFFEIRFLRKKTALWNLKNDLSIKTIICLLFQTCLISLQAVSMLMAVLMSMTFCAYILFQPEDLVGEAESTINNSCFRYRFFTDACVLISIILKNPDFAFGIWIAGIISLLGYHILVIYVRKHRKLFLPVCTSPPEQFYDFYYCCLEEFKGDEGINRQNMPQNTYIYHLHRFQCRQQCHLNEWLQLSSDKELQSLVSVILENKKNMSLHNKLVYQLWNLQMGKRCKVSVLFEKVESISQDFVLYCIDKMSKDSEITIQSSQSNKNAITKVFYDLIFETSSHYNLFYEELSRATPIIDSLIRHGIEIHQKIGKLKEIYADLLKLKMINFKMIELYIEFISRFVSENALDKDDISRLSKLQQNIYFQDISENYLPTLTFYPESGNIQNANGQAQKFLKNTRFELKCRSVYDISQPKLTLEQMHMLADRDEVNQSEDPVFLFFTRGQHNYGVGSLMVDERIIKSKKLLVMQITEQPFSSQKNVYLIDEKFTLMLSLKEFLKVKGGSYREQPLQLNWIDLYEKYVRDNKEKIERSKMVKISTQLSECTLLIKRLNCAVPGHHILEAHLMLQTVNNFKNRPKQNSVASFRRNSGNNHQQQRFEFLYSQNDDEMKSIIIGFKGDSNKINEKLRQKTLNAFEKGLTAEVVDKVLIEDTDYDRDIKTYRLWQGELYNIDLEDRQAYIESVEGKMPEEHGVEIENDSSFQCYVSVGVVILVLALIGISAFVIIQFDNSTVNIKTLSSQHSNIDSVMMDFNRILGLLRDLQTGFSAKFPLISIPAEIEDSYGRIQALKKQPLFSTTQHVLEYESLKMTGSLIELTDVIFAHINEVLASGQYQKIEKIYESSAELIQMMQQDQDDKYTKISLEFESLTFRKNISLYCSIGIMVLLFILLIYFCYRSNQKLRSNLSPLLYLSDGDAHICQDNASKIKYAVEMIRKNFEVDTQNLLISQIDGKRRKHPKKVALSTEIVVTVIFLAIIALSVHLGCLFVFSNQFQGSLAHFLEMKIQSQAIIQSYSAPTELANIISHQGQDNEDDGDDHNENIDQEFTDIEKQTNYIMSKMNDYSFSPQLNSYIHTLFFKDSCPVLMPRFALSVQDCYNTTPQFTIKNPFQLGLFYYFTRQLYYIKNNVTQLYAHTSIHSRPFAEIMTNLTVSFNQQSLITVYSIKNIVDVMSYIIIGIDIAYIIAFFAIQYYFRSQINSIRVIVEFFREKIVKGKEEDEEVEEDEDSLEDIQSDQELLGEEKKKPRDRKRKRTTIESKIALETHKD